jgi:NAD(P)-dependent dehydrogenase (short-subunit alcohol dehydrogenase family)
VTARPLDGRVALITGAARGIGAATARALAGRGMRLGLVGLEPDRLAALAVELGPGHAWAECDVTDQPSLDAAVRKVVAELGGIDVAIANAGIANQGTVATSPVSALVRTIEVNLVGVVRTVSATLPHVLERKGYVLLVSSAAAFTAMPGMAAYMASKAGVEQYGNGLRLELAHRGIDVGVAHMTWIDTDLVRDMKDDLPSFRRALTRMPGPLGAYTSVDACAAAFADAVEHRSRQVFVPSSLRWVAAARTLVLGRRAEQKLRRQARRLVPALEAETAESGRHFGAHSAGAGPAG